MKVKYIKGGSKGLTSEVPDDIGRMLVYEGMAAEIIEEKPKLAEPPRPNEAKIRSGEPIKRLSDIIKPRTEMRGERVAKEEIEGQEVVIQSFELRQSTAAGAKEGDQFALVQILMPDGTQAWLSIGAEQIVETLKEIETQLPVSAKFVSKKNPKTKRTYWVLE